jgi:hypothetical protein
MQTLPGKEFHVAEGLRKACKKAGVENFIILKGFGAFDIVFILEWKDFSQVLKDSGPIDGILKTSRSFCFEYEGGINKKFFETISEKTFLSLSLIKIKNDPQYYNYETEMKILDSHFEGDSTFARFGFGTLGWSEIILIYCGKDINQVVKATLAPNMEGTIRDIHKTYSLIALNHDSLPQNHKNVRDIQEFLTASKELNVPIANDAKPWISVISFPEHCNAIYNFWHDKGYDASDMVGQDDFQIYPPEGISWSQLLCDLMIFRIKFKNKIASTLTSISYKHTGKPRTGTATGKQNRGKPIFNYWSKDFKDTFKDSSNLLSGAFKTLNGLSQNSLISNAFSDLKEYPDYITTTAKKFVLPARVNFAYQTNELLRKGAELRLYGTYGTIEENVGQFNKLRGGVHRSVDALGYLVFKAIADVLDRKWQGFVTIGNQQFSNIHEVIMVPQEAIWNPGSWWAINHEIAHIIIDNIQVKDITDKFMGLMDPKLTELKLFVTQKNYASDWIGLVNEMAAEYVGYELGFYTDYDLFLKKVWGYIKSLIPKKSLAATLSMYAIRTYFVYFYERFFVGDGDRKLIGDYNYIYGDIIEHIEKIEGIQEDLNCEDAKKFYRDKYIVAAYYAPLFKELLPWLEKHFHPAMTDINCRRNKDELLDSNTRAVLLSLEEGIAWHDEIKYPEAVLCKLYQKKHLPFKLEIATILTFWNLRRKLTIGGEYV